ncbi:MAG TPA: BamA/TamA family outer membrane protein, partial [Bacteroidia bacterium]|nr:BamA/TamA family outer membrane protein [Bacteroidia bacterium]
EYLLSQNRIIYPDLANSKTLAGKLTSLPGEQIAILTLPPEIAVKQLMAYIKQKPNTKILGILPFHLLVYNLVDPEKEAEDVVLKKRKIDDKNKKIDEKNIIREQQHKKLKKHKSYRRTFGEWLMSVGEPPVILDSVLIRNSVKQLTLLLQSKGYFECRVSDSVRAKVHKAVVLYYIRLGKPHKIKNVQYEIEDPELAPFIFADSVSCLIKLGDNYNADNFQNERERITRKLNDEGFYAFSKSYVHYDIDSNMGHHQMNVIIGIKKYAVQDSAYRDSIIETPHKRFYINNMYVQMQYNPATPNALGTLDTLMVDSTTFLNPTGQLRFHPKRILAKIFFRKGDLYSISNVEYTYTGLSQLKVFRYVNIKFERVSPQSNLLNCYIQLMPNTRQSIALEGVGNNTGGALGVQGDLAYQNNSIFKGAELLQIKFKYGLEAQTLLSGTSQSTDVGKTLSLNTIDFGPEISLSVPRALIPFTIIPVKPRANPQTALKFTYDYQQQTEYTREIATIGYHYDWNMTDKWHVTWKFIEVSFVNAINSDAFLNAIKNTDNFILLSSFTTHTINDGGVTFIYNGQNQTKPHSFNFLRLDAELSGFVPHYVDQSLNAPDKLFGNPYSHYVLGQVDFRHYFLLDKEEKIVVRALAGTGIPIINDTIKELPFDKSFWAGGSDDIRAWAARTLGPGGYNLPAIIAQVGDIKLEANIEYRVSLIKLLGLGFFIDAGNVWLLNKNPQEPNANFLLTGPNNFLNQVAVGGGIGLRFDFTYFVFRFDFGVPFRDPAKPAGQEWLFNTPLLNRTELNLGIGYPF